MVCQKGWYVKKGGIQKRGVCVRKKVVNGRKCGMRVRKGGMPVNISEKGVTPVNFQKKGGMDGSL